MASARIFITGASTGLGEALARHYAARGAQLGLLARNRERVEALAGQLPGAVAYACDVRDMKAVRDAGRDFIARGGLPDLVIGNAGISHGTLTEHEEDAAVFRDILETNVMGLVHSFHPFVAAMRERGHGQLAGIASVAGLRGLPGSSAYSASKAAAIRYLEALRIELHGTGVGVTTVCPGYIATPMTARNHYRMPFLLQADEAARRIARVIDARRRYAIVPWQMAIGGRLMALLPAVVFDALAARAGRKPRRFVLD
ncbi:MAG TPA: SDR family oxidoreductase [Usitatibacter sp.]|jgi:short-subunit dehydrogenase|nr:SDR family oxidoreductase [Usitatibacter sp.]